MGTPAARQIHLLCLVMKKLFAFLLLVVSMAATFCPCCREDDYCSDDVASANHNNRKAEGPCSPFITCGTCPGFTQLTCVVEIPKPATDKVIHNASVKPFLLLTYSASLLQPPRIA